jgi:hypothetical protein
MNQLVQELAKQARYDSLLEKYYLQETHKRKITPTEYQHIYNKKFAELLVLECAKVVDGAISDGGVDGGVLKQHFGVKE